MVAKEEPLTVYTVGHSTLSLDEFVGLLRAYGIERLVDVRTIPRSRHNPQFNRDTLGKSPCPHGHGERARNVDYVSPPTKINDTKYNMRCPDNRPEGGNGDDD